MTSARALVWSLLLASAPFPAGAGALDGTPAASGATHACNPAWCTLARPTSAEHDAIVAEADRILARYAGDSTSVGRRCRALGATMKAHAADVRMIPYMWRATDPDGYQGPVTGDAHVVEPGAGSGIVHIARGYDPLNPDRGMDAILQTVRHEFAHLNGLRQSEAWGVDEAAQLATTCGQP